MKCRATGCGLISTVFSSIVFLCVSSIIIIIIIIIIMIIIIIQIDQEIPGTSKYQKAREKYYPWVSSVRIDPQSAYCGICLKSFKINNSGVCQLKSHSKCRECGERKETALDWKNQRTFVSGDS